MLTRPTRTAGVLMALVFTVAACGKGKDIHVDKLLLHRSGEQVLIVSNGTNETIMLVGAGPETPDRELAPDQVASISFQVWSFDDLEIADNEEWFERVGFPSNEVHEDSGTAYIAMDGLAATVTLRTVGGDEWPFRHDMDSCEGPGWEGKPVSSGSRRINVTGPPDPLQTLRLCPANSP